MAKQFSPGPFIADLTKGYISAGIPKQSPSGKPASDMSNGVGGAINKHLGGVLIELQQAIDDANIRIDELETELASATTQISQLQTTVSSLGNAQGAGGTP